LLQRFKLDFFALKSTAGQKKEKEMMRIFRRSTFFNCVCLYLHYLMMYPRIVTEAGNSASRLSEALREQQPDLIICDALWFTDWYRRIAQALDVPIIQNSFDGSLAYSQRPFVQTYGLTSTPEVVQSAVEAVSTVSKAACTWFYRLRHLGAWLKLRAARRTAVAQFDAAFPLSGGLVASPKWLVVGTARTERQRLGEVLRLKGADRLEFAALRFRSSLPVPPEIANWIEAAELPVVYVSFGSAVDIDERFAREVYNGLRGLRAKVLWSLPARQHGLVAGLPPADNIRLESFVPQPEILCLPKVKCFVTQGGPHSIQEALFGATPMLCIPFFVDQAYNGSVVEHLGAGKRLWRRDVSAESVCRAVSELLGNPGYQTVAKEISEDLARNEGGPAIAEYVRNLLGPSGSPEMPAKLRRDERASA
jgi:hypothetical protein